MRAFETRIYAAFPAARFGGNIAGVVYDEDRLSAEEMQGIAADLCAPTTGFARRVADDLFDVRFFSTRREMDMCGHVTIGIFAALLDDDRIPRAQAVYRQTTPAGEIGVVVRPTPEGVEIALRQPEPRFGLVAATPAEIAPLLGAPEAAIRSVASSSTALSHLFVEFAPEADLGAIAPSDDGLRAFSDARGIDTIGVWRLQEPGADGAARIRLRDLCHGVGDPEEAASGTTNGALAALLWREGRAPADASGCVRVRAEQGFEMGRPSLISTRLTVRDGAVREVEVGGGATRRLSGVYTL